MQALRIGNDSNPLLIQVPKEFTALASFEFDVLCCWIPSHIGIEGNKKVNMPAKTFFLNLEAEHLSLPCSDFYL